MKVITLMVDLDCPDTTDPKGLAKAIKEVLRTHGTQKRTIEIMSVDVVWNQEFAVVDAEGDVHPLFFEKEES